MEIKIKQTTGWDIALDSALFTVNKECKGKDPSDNWKSKICKAEHSILREVRFIIEIYGIPCWVSQHIARHDAFASHTVRESQETHFVGTSRTDRTGIDRNKLPQDAPVNHRISLSAQDFITISRKRLCGCASKETRDVWKAVIEELYKTNSVLASHCVPECVYRGFCPELEECGYCRSPKYEKQREEYTKK